MFNALEFFSRNGLSWTWEIHGNPKTYPFNSLYSKCMEICCAHSKNYHLYVMGEASHASRTKFFWDKTVTHWHGFIFSIWLFTYLSGEPTLFSFLHTCAHPAHHLIGAALSMRETWDPPLHFPPIAKSPLLPVAGGLMVASCSFPQWEHEGAASSVPEVLSGVGSAGSIESLFLHLKNFTNALAQFHHFFLLEVEF